MHIFHPLRSGLGRIRLPDVEILCDLSNDAHKKNTIYKRESLKVEKTVVIVVLVIVVVGAAPYLTPGLGEIHHIQSFNHTNHSSDEM